MDLWIQPDLGTKSCPSDLTETEGGSAVSLHQLCTTKSVIFFCSNLPHISVSDPQPSASVDFAFFFAVLWVRLGVAAAAPKEDQDVSNARDAATHGFLSFF